jgi:glycosyltransferase involved in cell wall biosynthesis
MSRKLLVLDTSYGYEAIVARQLQASVTCRDLGGFFEHVWTVHPFASLVSEGATTRFGRPDVHQLSPIHSFIDGKIGRFEALHGSFVANFLLSQADLIARLVGLIRRERISVIRAGEPLYTGLLAWALSRACGIPFIVRVAANFDQLYESTGRQANPRLFPSIAVEKKILRFVLTRADLAAAVNQDNLNFAFAYGARESSSTIFRYGNLIDKRHVADPATRPRDATLLDEFWPRPYRFLLHVGRLEPIKCPADVLHILALVRANGHDVKLLMVGDGQQRAELGRLAHELGIEQHVAFTGNRGQDWLSHMIPQAAVVVSPITGRALSEAAFGSAKIVAYDLDWQRELIRTGETGELVPARSCEKAARSVERFLSDPAYGDRMGAAVRRAAFEMLDPATLDRHEREAYTRLLTRR